MTGKGPTGPARSGTSAPGNRAATEFGSDPGASRAFWIACALVLAISGWMGSGFFLPDDAPAEAPAETAAPEPPAVLVRTSQARQITLTLGAEGQALPDRDTEVRAEASGTVVALPVAKGATVTAGSRIARLSSDQARAALRQAEEELARARREFDNANALLDRGVATQDRVAEARATLAAAESQLAAAERTLEDLTIVAPFDGRLERLDINEGEFVAAGDSVARVVDNDPLTIAIQVPQQSLNRLQPGQGAEVAFITGQTRSGTVSFVGTAAAAETRTFLAEIEVPNPDGEIPAGVSAEVTIPTGAATAHLVQPSIVSLDPDGALGVKTVEDGRVRFYAIEVVRAEITGVWVAGLPETARIITVGQGFVRDGEAVRAQSEPAEPGPGPSDAVGSGSADPDGTATGGAAAPAQAAAGAAAMPTDGGTEGPSAADATAGSPASDGAGDRTERPGAAAPGAAGAAGAAEDRP